MKDLSHVFEIVEARERTAEDNFRGDAVAWARRLGIFSTKEEWQGGGKYLYLPLQPDLGLEAYSNAKYWYSRRLRRVKRNRKGKERGLEYSSDIYSPEMLAYQLGKWGYSKKDD